MANKISNFVFLISLFLLQSCSGGKIGNFLESSFNNNSNKISQNDINNNLKSNKIFKDKKFEKVKDITTKTKLRDDTKPQNTFKSSLIQTNDVNTNDVNKIKKINQNYEARSYRVFVILKKVDPSFPTENFSKVLRDGDINFEIEKIELMYESNKNKK